MYFRVIPVIILGLAVGASSAFPAASEDVQVIHAKKSVMVIYNYGQTAQSEPGPDFSIAATVPGTTSSLSPTPAPAPARAKAQTATPALAPVPDAAAAPPKAPGSSADESPAFNPVPIPDPIFLPNVVTLLWNPSPDDSVVGYALYSGTASQQYSTRQILGNQTSVSIVLDQPITYFAVTAYTVEGLESVPSEELAVPATEPTRNRTLSRGAGPTASQL